MESQEVVPGQTEPADRGLRIDTNVESVPLASVEPDHAPRYDSEVGPLGFDHRLSWARDIERQVS